MPFDLIFMMIALFAVMYFLMIRPQQKRAKQHQEMQSGLSEGERILLTSGMFGTVAHVGERQLIVELAPGVEVTVLKGNVARTVSAEDEPARMVGKLDAIERAQIDDLSEDLLEVIDLLPGGRYGRHALCNQLNSILTAHGWGYTHGTVS